MGDVVGARGCRGKAKACSRSGCPRDPRSTTKLDCLDPPSTLFIPYIPTIIRGHAPLFQGTRRGREYKEDAGKPPSKCRMRQPDKAFHASQDSAVRI